LFALIVVSTAEVTFTLTNNLLKSIVSGTDKFGSSPFAYRCTNLKMQRELVVSKAERACKWMFAGRSPARNCALGAYKPFQDLKEVVRALNKLNGKFKRYDCR